ncbi:MAG: transketolase, partial [Flavobacterium sp.]|nr:transketolase [Flavobacterium sp.]
MKPNIQQLQDFTTQVRRDILRMVHAVNSGHPGGSLGCTEFLTVLYQKLMDRKPEFDMDGIGEDLFFLSNGHISPVFYSVLSRSGYFPVDELSTFRLLNSRLQGHPTTHDNLPGVRIASGSLGQGLSVAIGAAQAKKLNNCNHIVYTLHGDGELQEGQNWEAIMYASAKGVDNLIATIDLNGKQIDGTTDEVLNMGSLRAKFESFDWEVIDIKEGNNIEAIIDGMTFAKSRTGSGKPICVLLHTEMGNGVNYMMYSHAWHGKAPNDAQLENALAQNPETLGDYKLMAPNGGMINHKAQENETENQLNSLLTIPSTGVIGLNTGSKDTRSGFGAGMTELGQKNENVVALCADLIGSLKFDDFKKNYPERFFQIGIAEANMIGIAAGLTIGGKIPFTGTFANFSTGRVYDQIRQSVAYSNKNVKICASHAGLTLGEDGATHQILEDIGLMKMLPGMTVINTCDYNQTKAATLAIADHEGPVYLRFGRPVVPNFMPDDTPFEIGKAIVLKEGNDVTIVATGHLVWEALLAAEKLQSKGISAEVINIHTIKPLDEIAILRSVAKTKCIVTAEEHNIMGGLGESIARVLSLNHPASQEFVAVNDSFGESGTPEQLMNKYKLNNEAIVKAVEKVIKR